MSDERRETIKVWDAKLSGEGKEVTIPELTALELMHLCSMLQTMLPLLGYSALNLAALDARLNRLETYIRMVDARYPATEEDRARIQAEIEELVGRHLPGSESADKALGEGAA